VHSCRGTRGPSAAVTLCEHLTILCPVQAAAAAQAAFFGMNAFLAQLCHGTPSASAAAATRMRVDPVKPQQHSSLSGGVG
jgi:hypothetical protein